MTREDVARGVIDANRYMTLATADADGRPWASPVWFAHAGYREFLWISRPEARHSRNLAVRPEVGIVIFDSTVAPGEAQPVYVEASAVEVDGAERERGVETYRAREVEQGIEPLTLGDVVAPAPHRLYRATALAHFVLGPGDRREPITL